MAMEKASTTCWLGKHQSSGVASASRDLVGKPETQLDQHVWIAQRVDDTKRATSWFDFHV